MQCVEHDDNIQLVGFGRGGGQSSSEGAYGNFGRDVKETLPGGQMRRFLGTELSRDVDGLVAARRDG